ncbi:hypothetical protein TEA_024644 [Camellia sinensis var. sinensis]|uniref:Uncharacterized protein n=1 Tax=Camellia sinensis var. sinensis TaxID=542762 RepID=A0A4S4D194_CAMSN|nr:hypothetical protein TEA_024644 [Camellia sinensis var. sinensis]
MFLVSNCHRLDKVDVLATSLKGKKEMIMRMSESIKYENMKPGPISERIFGLFMVDGTPTYSLRLDGGPTTRFETPTRRLGPPFLCLFVHYIFVAKSFDAPIKLLFPTSYPKRPFSMLGLGDINHASYIISDNGSKLILTLLGVDVPAFVVGTLDCLVNSHAFLLAAGLASNKITVGLAREVTRIDKFNSGKGELINETLALKLSSPTTTITISVGSAITDPPLLPVTQHLLLPQNHNLSAGDGRS